MSDQILSPSQNKIKRFKCSEHLSTVSKKLQTYYEEGDFYDITLIAGVDHVEVQAHRLVLSASSPYFEGMFRKTKKDAITDEVELKESDGATIKSVLEFMYTASIELQSESILNVLRLADYLKLNTLTAACCEFIGENLNPSNCLGNKLFAEQHNYTNLLDKSASYCLEHFQEVSKGTEFLHLNEEQVAEMLTSDDLRVSSEEIVFNSIVAWVEKDKKSREALLLKLLPSVRFQFLNPRFIVDHRHAVCNSSESYELLCSWLHWHLFPENQLQEVKPRKYFDEEEVSVCVGYDTDDWQITTYERELNTWTIKDLPKPPMKHSAYNYSSIVIDNRLYFVGGEDNGDTYSNKVVCLDLRTMKYTRLPPMQQSRSLPALVELDGDLYAVGGLVLKDDQYTGSMEKYSFSECKWHSLAPIRKSRSFFKIAAYGGLLYALGEDSFQCYDPSENRWFKRAPPNFDYNEVKLVTLDDCLYAIGGLGLHMFMRYNKANDTWEIRCPMSVARTNVSCIAYKNRLIAIGGYLKNHSQCNLVEEYDPETDNWVTLAPLEAKEFNVGGISIKKIT